MAASALRFFIGHPVHWNRIQGKLMQGFSEKMVGMASLRSRRLGTRFSQVLSLLSRLGIMPRGEIKYRADISLL